MKSVQVLSLSGVTIYCKEIEYQPSSSNIPLSCRAETSKPFINCALAMENRIATQTLLCGLASEFRSSEKTKGMRCPGSSRFSIVARQTKQKPHAGGTREVGERGPMPYLIYPSSLLAKKKRRLINVCGLFWGYPMKDNPLLPKERESGR
jgi:hypothetical protein